jgi:hypothetical protein
MRGKAYRSAIPILLVVIACAGCAHSPSVPQASTSPPPPTAATPLPTIPAPAGPTVAITCPKPSSGPWAWYDVSYGYRVAPGSSPITRYDINYGDGHAYTNNTIAQVFSHRYTRPGIFVTTVTLTDAANRTGMAFCYFAWASTSGGGSGAPGLNFIPYPGNGLGPTQCSDGSISNSSGSGTCSHHGGEAG